MATFVLVHPAFVGGWIWHDVATPLRALGHEVHTPTLEGCAERTHQLNSAITCTSQAREIANYLFYEDLKDVILAGTGAGGVVISKVADVVPERVGHLIFASAVTLKIGESIRDVTSPRSTGITTTLAFEPDQESAEKYILGDTSAKIREWALDRITPHPLGAIREKMSFDCFWDRQWDVTVIRSGPCVNPSESIEKRTASLLKAQYIDLGLKNNGAPYQMLTHPQRMVDLFHEIATRKHA